MQGPALGSTSDRISTNQRLNNITAAQVNEELNKIRSGNGRRNFSELNGKLMYADACGRREVLPVEERDTVLAQLHKRHGYPGVARRVFQK